MIARSWIRNEHQPQRHRSIPGRDSVAVSHLCRCRSEDVPQVRLDGEVEGDGVEGSVGIELGSSKGQLLAPDRASLEALLDNTFREAAENLERVAAADARQTGMIWQRLTEVIAEAPAPAEPIWDRAQEFALGAEALVKTPSPAT